MSKKYSQHTRNPALELAQFKRGKIFDPLCVCKGLGHRGRIKSGDKKGLYVPCTSGKAVIDKDIKTMIDAPKGNIPLKR